MNATSLAAARRLSATPETDPAIAASGAEAAAAVLLDRNENRYGPAPACLEALQSIEPAMLSHYTRNYTRGYYSSLSRKLAELHRIDDARIVLGYGCEDLLKQAVHHFLQRGEKLLIPSASWWYYHAIATEVGGTTVEYPLRETKTAYVYDIQAMKRLHREVQPRLVLIASPNNPTGNAMTRAALHDVLDDLQDTIVVLDQAYYGFNGREGDELARLTDRYPNLLVLRTFSKLFGLAGARIGYGITGAGLDGFRAFSSRHLGYNRISERLALAALDSPDYYAGVRARIALDRRRVVDRLRRFAGTRVYDSQAPFVLVRFPAGITAGLRAGLTERGLIVKFFDEAQFAHCARISLGTTSENSRLLDAFDQLMPNLLTTRA